LDSREWSEVRIGTQPGFFDIEDRLKRLSDLGDQLEAYAEAVDFEMFRPDLEKALNYSDGTKGGRPPLDAVLMFKILVIQAQNNLRRPLHKGGFRVGKGFGIIWLSFWDGD
jgi:hypothetical protein